jgi:hypothetical protein
MKKHYYLNKKAVFFLIFILCVVSSKASIIGSVITYKAIDSVKYEVTLTVFRDCNGATMPTTMDLDVTGKPTGVFTIALPKISSRDVTGINPNCKIFKSKCSGGNFQYGIEEIVYRGVVNISEGGCQYTFAFDYCCRSSSITTGAANQNHYNFAMVNKCYGENNSVLAETPSFLIGRGRDFSTVIFKGDTVNTQDSIVYFLAKPMSGATTFNSYSGSWSYLRPFSFLGFPNTTLSPPAGFHFNAATSELSFRPTTNNQQTVLCVEAKEYRRINGKIEVVGVSRMDYSASLVNIGFNRAPTIQGQNFVRACIGDTTEIEITTNDIDFNDTTFLDVANIPTEATVSFSRVGKHAKAIIKWVPKLSDVNPNPYSIVATATDDECILVGKSVKAFSILVQKIPDVGDVKILSKTPQCNSAEVILSVSNKLQNPIISMVDEDSMAFLSNDTSRLYFKNSGWSKFHVTVKSDNYCDYVQTDSVLITPQYNIQLNTKKDTAVCKNENVTFFTTPSTGTAPYTYKWVDRGTRTTKYNTATFSQKMLASQLHSILVVDANYCAGIDSVDITVNDLPIVDLGYGPTVCPNDSFKLTAKHVSGAVPAKYNWFGKDTLQSLKTAISSTRKFYVEGISQHGCKSPLDSIEIKVHSIEVDAGTYYGNCVGWPVTLVAYPLGGLKPFNYSWVNSNSNTSVISIYPSKDTSLVVRMEDFRGCVVYDTAFVPVFVPTSFQAPSNVSTCSGVSTSIKLTNIIGDGPFSFFWNGVQGVDSLGIAPNKTESIKAEIMDINGCMVEKDITVTVYQNPEVKLGQDKTVCRGSKQNLIASVSQGKQPYNYLWSDGSTGPIFSTTVNAKRQITLKVEDANGCKGDDIILLDTLPSQRAILTPFTEPFCEEDPPVSLQSIPVIGTWTGAGVNGKIFNPNTAGAGMHTLKFNFISQYNCPEQDEIYAVVKQVPKVGFTVDKTKGLLNTVFNFTNTTQADTTYTSEWSMGDGNILTAQNPSYTYPKAGKYTVILKVDNGVCAVQSIQKSGYIQVDSVITSVFQLEKAELKVYPNPISDKFTIKSESEINKVTLHNIFGKQVIAQEINALITNINVGRLSKGIYTLTIELNTGVTKTTKMVVK